MANKKISEFELTSAVVDSVVPVSDASGTITNKVTLGSIANLATPESIGAAPAVHDHNDVYYTETEVDTLLTGKSDTGHTHDDRYYTETEVDNLLSEIGGGGELTAPGSHEIYVDNARTDTYTEDGSIYRPYKTLRSALASVTSAADKTEFNDLTKRFYCFRIAPGLYDEEAGGTLTIPTRPVVTFDVSGGATLKGNFVWNEPNSLIHAATGSELGNAVFAMIGSNNRPLFDNGQHSYVGIQGNLEVVRLASKTGFMQVHLIQCGVRGVISFSGNSTDNQVYCANNSTFGTLKTVGTANITLYATNSESSSSGNNIGNIIGRINIVSLENVRVHFRASVFPTANVAMLNMNAAYMPGYTEINATSFVRSGNIATVTLSRNHNQSLTTTPDGYVQEQYVIIKGVSENGTFNTATSGAKVVAYPAANQVSYENTGADISVPVVASNAFLIKGSFFGNATGYIQPNSVALHANEASIHTHSGWINNGQPGSGTNYIFGRSSAVVWRYPLTAWVANATIVKHRLLIPGNGYQYRALPAGVGVTGSTEPVWPTVVGETVVDNTITWHCETLGFVPLGIQSVNVQQAIEVLHDSKNIYYDNADSGLIANAVKGAVDELSANKVTNAGNVSAIQRLTQAEYDIIVSPDPNTLYVIVG